MLFGDPYESGFEHKFLYWCPECHNIEEVELINPICQMCGANYVDIDERMYPIIFEFEKQNIIKTLACCEGHFKESKPDVYEWISPYLLFSVNPEAKISDIFNGKFPMLTTVGIVPDVTFIDEDDDKMLFYKILSKQADNYQFNMNWCIYMDDSFIPTIRDRDSHISSENLWNKRKDIFLNQLLEWAKSLKVS
jgi:hypothetical protein